MTSIKKALGGAALTTAGLAASAATLMPATAFASTHQWGTDILSEAGVKSGGNFSPAEINAETVSGWVQQFTTWILGIAICLFVLRVVLTAIDRIFLGSKGGGSRGSRGGGSGDGGGSFLTEIPIIGAYPENVEWKQVWISFGKNIGIVVGAWIIVQIISGGIVFLFSSMQGK